MMVLPSRTVLAEQNSWGAGVGIPYGLMGVNVDYNIISNLDVSFGIGVNPLSGLCYNMGEKLHLASEEKRFRPRISCYYGTNTIVEEPGFLSDDYTNYNGVTAGVGARIFFGATQQHGLDFDLLYIISTEADIDQLEAEGYDVSGMDDIKISIGYRRFF
jgi:hypothetical protein